MKAIFDLMLIVCVLSGITTYLGMKFVEWIEMKK